MLSDFPHFFGPMTDEMLLKSRRLWITEISLSYVSLILFVHSTVCVCVCVAQIMVDNPDFTPSQVGGLFTFLARQLAKPDNTLFVNRNLFDQVRRHCSVNPAPLIGHDWWMTDSSHCCSVSRCSGLPLRCLTSCAAPMTTPDTLRGSRYTHNMTQHIELAHRLYAVVNLEAPASHFSRLLSALAKPPSVFSPLWLPVQVLLELLHVGSVVHFNEERLLALAEKAKLWVTQSSCGSWSKHWWSTVRSRNF